MKKNNQKYSDEQVRKSAVILKDCGIYLSVPGWLDLSTPDDAVRFARDPEGFYNAIEENNQKATLNEIEILAQECGCSLEDYLYYLKYSKPSLYEKTGASDTDFFGGPCSAITSKGHQCKNHVQFHGKFSSFKKGVSDRCSVHKKKQ